MLSSEDFFIFAVSKARPKRHAAAAPRWTRRASAVGWEFPSWRNFRKIHGKSMENLEIHGKIHGKYLEIDEISRWDFFVEIYSHI